MTPISLNRLSARPPRGQRGVVLMVALIVLVALTLAGLSMVRSADTATTVAGNLVFRQAATQALDAGIEAAIATVNATWVGSSNTIPHKYYAYAQAQDAQGLPAGVDFNQANALVNPGGLTGYTARYVVERMCVPPTAGTITNSLQAETENLCYLEEDTPGKQSAKLGGQSGLGEIRKVHFRVTVRVDGPRNTQTHAQVVLAAPIN